MMIGETIRVAFSSIRSNKLRAGLTMLGIIIGVGAVIAVVALGTGAQTVPSRRASGPGRESAHRVSRPVVHGRTSERRAGESTVDDATALSDDAKLLTAVEPELSRSLQVKYGNRNFNINILGTTSNYPEVRNYTVTHGRMFTQGDDGARQRYAVLGSAVPAMFGVNPVSLINTTIRSAASRSR